MNKDYSHYMHQCLQLAKLALAAGDPPVGVLIVFEDSILGKGIESGKSTGDITNHAEILAVRDVIKNGHLDKLSRSTMYTTHEPCIMCSYVLRHHQIPKIVYGTSVPFVGGFSSKFNVLSTSDVPKWGEGPEIVSGICINECVQLNEDFKKALAKS
ncbi:nucleoside deaminase [Pedobacter aquatilis]|uniref:nucleoside deaminase n=1 Tax=Pedobacter aquatilis TaxID=351343 RepID=UPI00292F6066|nr:nucleoside deaminase [Pedobacter aquatilis]